MNDEKQEIEKVQSEMLGGVQDKVLTLEEAAELLRVGRQAILSMTSEGKIPARKVGREWRFSKNALFMWLHGYENKA